MNQKKNLALAFVILSCLLAAVSWLIPATNVDDTSAFHSLFSIALVVTVLHTGAAVLFLRGLENFKAALKRAYRLMCAGFILLGLTFFQSPILSLYNLWDSAWVEYGGIILPFVLSALFLFLGMRTFARLLQIRNASSSFWAVTGALVVVSAIVVALPHPPIDNLEELFVDVNSVLSATIMVYLAAAMLLAVQIKRRISAQYQPAVQWLIWTFAVGSLAGLQHLVLGMALSHEHWYQSYGYSVLPHLVDGLLALRAGYEFSKTTESDEIANGALSETNDESTGNAVLAATTYLASLASTPAAIDPMLDDVREISSSLPADAELSPSDQHQLVKVYHNLEDYLVQREPLRQFDRDTLRQHVITAFCKDGKEVEFWKALKADAAPAATAHKDPKE